jgi:hypothetical protein
MSMNIQFVWKKNVIFQRSRNGNPPWQDVANNLLLRLMVVVEDTLQELGASQTDLVEVQKKRSRITACYFQAITCYWRQSTFMYINLYGKKYVYNTNLSIKINLP